MLIAAVVVTPIGGWEVMPALTDPVALLAGIGVGLSSSVIPYVSDQLAIGIVVLAQVPSVAEAAGVALVIVGVALHRQPARDHDEPADDEPSAPAPDVDASHVRRASGHPRRR